MRPKRTDRALDQHRYILWRDNSAREDGTIISDHTVMSMGEHGAMHAIPLAVQGGEPGSSKSGDRLDDRVAHNITELERAREEAKKWEERLKRFPLAKPPQDFVAYYTEVIAAFTEWCAAHGIPIPSDR